MKTFLKNLIVFSAAIAIAVAASVNEASAKVQTKTGKGCGNNNSAGPGLYCGASLTKECKPGCYCKGGTKSFVWTAGDVKKGCERRWSKVTTELSKPTIGIYLCPEGFYSDAGAKKIEDCYLKDHKSIKYKQINCEKGKYLPKASASCAVCPENSRCPGIKQAIPSTSDQGITKCPAYEHPNADHTACEKDKLTCPAGQYLPANSLKCNSCKTGNYYCPGVTNVEVPSTVDKGLEACDTPNEQQTKCVNASETPENNEDEKAILGEKETGAITNITETEQEEPVSPTEEPEEEEPVTQTQDTKQTTTSSKTYKITKNIFTNTCLEFVDIEKYKTCIKEIINSM